MAVTSPETRPVLSRAFRWARLARSFGASDPRRSWRVPPESALRIPESARLSVRRDGQTTITSAASYGLLIPSGNVGIGTTAPGHKLDIMIY